MILTDIDGIQFELEPAMVKGLITRKKNGGNFTEVETFMCDYLLVRETPAQIMNMINKEKKHE